MQGGRKQIIKVREKGAGNKDVPGQYSGAQHSQANSRANPVTLY